MNSSSEQQNTLASFVPKLIITVAVVTVIGLVALLLASAANIIPFVFISILFAILLRAFANPLGRHLPILSQRWAVIVVMLLIVILLGLFIAISGPHMVEQFAQLIDRMPEALGRIEQALEQYPWGPVLLNTLGDVPSTMNNLNVVPRLTGFFSGAFGMFTTTVMILIAGIYLAFEPKLYIENFIRLFPIKRRDRVRDVLSEGYDMVRLWLLARLMSMLVVGILSFIGLTLVGMPLALSLAIIAGVLSFIPNIGPILAAIPAVLVGLTQSLTLGLLAAVVYFIVQQIENYLITPNIQREMVSLPPALVILTQVFLALLFGWLGLFIAAPLVAFGIVLVKSVYVEDILGDEVGSVTER